VQVRRVLEDLRQVVRQVLADLQVLAGSLVLGQVGLRALLGERLVRLGLRVRLVGRWGFC
jgi:hypothetical protein